MQRPNLHRTHEQGLTHQASTRHFKFKTTILRNIEGNRCVLLRCSSPNQLRIPQKNTCDILYLQITATKHNRSALFCPVDYVAANWDELSLTYNEGISFLADHVSVRPDARHLPLEGKHKPVHFGRARDPSRISPDWFSVFPSNETRALFVAWSLAPATGIPPHHSSLNRARTCLSKDVTCHSRRGILRFQCDGASDGLKCLNPDLSLHLFRAIMIVIGTIIAASHMQAAVATVLPKWRTPAKQKSMPLSSVLLALACVVALGANNWTVPVRMITNIFGLRYDHRFEEAHFESGDIYRVATDLRGRYDGYAYIFRDGALMVRVAGPGISAVVAIVTSLFFFTRVCADGFLATGLLGLITVQFVCWAVVAVVGSRGRKDDDDDEYFVRRSDVIGLRRQGVRRNFLRPSNKA